jgi:hypothetical protein
MPESEAIQVIKSVQKKWMVSAMLSYYLVLLAFSFLVVTVLMKLLGLPWWWYVFAATLSLVIIYLNYNSRKVSETEVTRFLNQQFPQLEESSGLLLKPYESLNLLEKLQVKKVQQAITQLPAPVSFNEKLKQPVLLLIAGMAISTVLLLFPFPHHPLNSSIKLILFL